MSTTKDTEAKKEALKIEVERPADFNAIGDIEVTTTELLAKTINQILKPTFNGDYSGCNIRVVPVTGRGLVLESRLYFRILSEAEYNDPNKVFAFIPASFKQKKDGNTIVSTLQRISLLADNNMNNRVTVTDDAKSALAEFIVQQAKNGNGEVKWNECTNVQSSGNNTFACVFKIDINKLIAKIYGEVDKDGTPLYYSIYPTMQLSGAGIYGNQECETWGLNIIRLHHGEISKVSKMLGLPVPSEYGMPQMVPAE